MKAKRGLSFVMGLGVLLGATSFGIPVYAEGESDAASSAIAIGDGDNLYAAFYYGGEYKLANDIDFSSQYGSVIYALQDTTLDLNGYTLTFDQSEEYLVTYGGNVTIKGEGEIRKTVEAANAPVVYVYADEEVSATTLTQEGGKISAISNAVYVANDSKYILNGGEVVSGHYGIIGYKNAIVEINGGKVTAGAYAVSGQGLAEHAGASFTVNDGELISTEDYAIYMPQVDGALTVNGGAITGAAGAIAVNRGEINVYGGTLTSLGTVQLGGQVSQDGTRGYKNAVIEVAKESGSVNLTIEDGEFVAEGDAKLFEELENTNTATVAISGGVFSAEPEHSYVVENKDIFQTDEGYVVDGKINLPTDESMAITLFKGESFDVGFKLDKRGEHARLIADDSGLYTFDGMTITAGDNFGQAKYKVNYGGLIYNQEPEEYDIEVIEVPEFEVVADEKLGLSDEVVAAIAGKVKDILEGKVYVAEDGSISWVSEDGKVWADPGHVKEAVTNDETLRVEMRSEEILMDELDEEGLAQLNEILEDGDMVVSMHDIELVIVNAEGYEIGGVDVLDEPVALTFVVPEEMREAPEGYTRKFYVIRYHYDRISGAQIDRLKAEFDGENATIQNDKFSGFVLVYRDEENAVTPGTGRFTKETEDFAKSSKSYGMLVLAMGMIVLGYGLVLQGKKYKI